VADLTKEIDMATPTLSADVDKASYLPGETITATWESTDADNSSEELVFQGHDSQGLAVEFRLQVNRLDPFTMTRVFWARTNTNLTINAAARTATGTVPSA